MVRNKIKSMRPKVVNRMRAGLQRLIQGLLNQDIAKRLTVEQVRQDTWLFGLPY